MRTYLSFGDWIDLYFKLRQKRYRKLILGFNRQGKERTAAKWNSQLLSSDFWMIPEVRKRWNEKCTGHPDREYEDYFVQRYLPQSRNLRMLSVGCGSGARERKFARFPQFASIEGIDLAEKRIDEARKEASVLNLHQVHYHAGDFLNHPFACGTYDVVLFHSSLHHFNHLSQLIPEKVLPLLKPGGYLVLFEYTGPNRLQWSRRQLKRVNEILSMLPERYRKRRGNSALKRKAYRPGWIRMLLVDPSEAPDSESILPEIHRHFRTLEEKHVGWNLTHVLFKDIAHNFLQNDEETRRWIDFVFEKEDAFLKETGHSDAVFGIYQKKES
ncbi:MAG TPA: class I SAM-dependent methyltransferase [Prolixibacteraceae bacterium]|nr:class I SAM-dependent methyltransferase [Prolixibacteraceae bacterium]